MTFVPPRDRVAESSTSNSQSVFALAGALDTSFNAFSASMGVGDTTIGGVVEAGVAFKSGILTYSAANEVTVSTVKESRGTFSASGIKHVFMGLPGLVALMVDGAQALTAAQQAQGLRNLGFDVWRQNILLERIYQSKSFAGYRRFINGFADGYKASDGINAGASSNYTVDASGGRVTQTLAPPTTSYSNSGGQGDRTASITVTISGSVTGGSSVTNLVDGVAANNLSDGLSLSAGDGPATNRFFRFDFGAGVKKYFSEVTIKKTGATSNGSGWLIQVSDDASNWTTISSSFTWNQATQIVPCSGQSAAGNRYIQIISPGSNTINPGDFYQEVEFKIAAGITSGPASDMTLVTVAQTADASVSGGRVLLEIDNVETPTLNTDLTVDVTCNGGANWSAATLASVSANGQAGRKIVETADVACTAGTSFAARVKTFNGKNVPIHGLSLTAW